MKEIERDIADLKPNGEALKGYFLLNFLRHGLGGGCRGFCDDSFKASLLKMMTMMRRGVKNCVTSFTDVPFPFIRNSL